MTFVSYAQNFEDLMLWRALKNEKPGTYIDVGACDPDAESVTRAFYERGWRGINIEPVVDSYNRILQKRPDEINLCTALDSYIGKTKFFYIDNGNGLSTANPILAQEYYKTGWKVDEVKVPVTTLSDICERYIFSTPIHFLKIDVEGRERAVLEGADLNRFRPWIILIEDDKNLDIGEDILLAAQYSFIYYDGLNRFYIANEHKKNLSSSFYAPPNINDKFIKISEMEIKLKVEKLEQELIHEQQISAQISNERDAFHQELFESNRYAAWLSQERYELLKRLDEIRLSTCWRLTAPLRMIIEKLKSITRDLIKAFKMLKKVINFAR